MNTRTRILVVTVIYIRKSKIIVNTLVAVLVIYTCMYVLCNTMYVCYTFKYIFIQHLLFQMTEVVVPVQEPKARFLPASLLVMIKSQSQVGRRSQCNQY